MFLQCSVTVRNVCACAHVLNAVSSSATVSKNYFCRADVTCSSFLSICNPFLYFPIEPLPCYGGVYVPGWAPGICAELPGVDVPVGSLHQGLLGADTVQGWACDAHAPNATLLIQLSIDNKEVARVKAAVPRPDLPAHSACSSPDHGLAWKVPLASLPPGRHMLAAAAFAGNDPDGRGQAFPIGNFFFSVKP